MLYFYFSIYLLQMLVTKMGQLSEYLRFHLIAISDLGMLDD